MKENTTEQMNASQVFCPNRDCRARGKIGEGNIVIHGKKRPRYRCKTCGRTFSSHAGTMFEGLRKPKTLIVIVVTSLSYGCPVQAIVQALGLDERTVAAWRDRAGVQCQKVHVAIVEQGKLDLVHVQADEIRVKGRVMVVWMGLAMMVSTRLWLAGAVSQTRDHHLADRLLSQVRACALAVRTLLVATDGWTAYPKSIKRAFREKVKETAGKGRACLRVWTDLCIVTVIKRTEKKHVIEVTRKLTFGKEKRAELDFAPGDLAVVERLAGDANTAWGVPSVLASAETRPIDAVTAQRNVALLRASWDILEEVVAASPAELRKGPRGGGRDRDEIRRHVIEAERAYARKIGVRHKPFEVNDKSALKAMRGEIAAVLSKLSTGQPLVAGGWNASYAVRRMAWHVIDHIWEIEDRRS